MLLMSVINEGERGGGTFIHWSIGFRNMIRILFCEIPRPKTSVIILVLDVMLLLSCSYSHSVEC